MSIVFEMDKGKSLSMIVETSGIDNDKLDFVFSIFANGVKYGFPCKMTENKVSINIPALNKVIKDIKPGEYQAFLEVTGEDKYYLRPFNEKIVVNQPPKIDVKISENKDDIKVSVNKLIEDLVPNTKPKVEVKETKNKSQTSHIGQLFGNKSE